MEEEISMNAKFIRSKDDCWCDSCKSFMKQGNKIIEIELAY